MNCRFTEKVSSLIDGELSPAEAREVERHLMTCMQCAETRADFLSLRTQISSFEASLPGAVQNRALENIAIVALIVGLNFYRQPEEVALQSPPPVASPTVEPSPEAKPSPAVEPEEKTETSKPKPTPARKPLVREPKPGEQFASIPKTAVPKTVIPETIRSADAQTMTALHFEKAENLLRAFRNVRLDDADAAAEVRYERKRAEQLIYQNMMLRREADAAGDVQIASLLDSLEPILLDIANLPDRPDEDTVRVIRERVERKNIVALLQINSTALARALD
jgi:hypothetical protein